MIENKGPVPTKITLHKKSRLLEVEFDSQERFLLPCAYLRAFSTSAEMRHGPEQGKTMADYANVNILSIEPVGHYAIKPVFSDGHRTGVYSWSNLYELGLRALKP